MMLPASSLAIELSAARGVRVIRCKSRKTKQTWPLLAVWMVLDAMWMSVNGLGSLSRKFKAECGVGSPRIRLRFNFHTPLSFSHFPQSEEFEPTFNEIATAASPSHLSATDSTARIPVFFMMYPRLVDLVL